jgi:acetolactate synthase I/II/III large subunit
MATAADIIARRLFDAGVRHAFGIPGGEVLTMMAALQNAGIEFQLVKHENPGGFMAEGTHHFTKAPCVLLATVGPGVANAVNAVVNAFQDQVPLIYLTGCVDENVAHTYTHQVFDHVELLKPVTKASFTAVDGAIDVVIDKAVSIAMDGRPGPVLVDLPISVAARDQPDHGRSNRVPPSPMAPAPGPDLEDARKALREAKKPLVLGGVDVLHQDAADAVADFAREFSTPLITTYKAKGILSEDHALALGGAGLSPKADAILQPLIDESDLIILAGYDPIEMRSSWTNPWGVEKMVIEFSAVANTHYVHQARLSFVGHVGAGLSALSDGIKGGDVWVGGAPEKVRQTLMDAFSAGDDWGPAAAVHAARRAFPRNGVAAVDTGAHRILLSQAWQCYEPRGLLQSTGLCTMGVALPLVIGRKLAEPDRPVIAFTGDAGMEMILGELATLRDTGLTIPVVVFVDEALALIELKQRGSGMQNLGVDFGGTDFVGVAEAMGGVGVVAASADAMETEVAAALNRDGFTLIACPIGRKAYDGKF